MPNGDERGGMMKARLDMRLDRNLKEWISDYAARKGTTVTNLVVDYFNYLRDKEAHLELADEEARQI